MTRPSYAIIGIETETEVEQRGDHIEPVHPHGYGEQTAAEHLDLVREIKHELETRAVRDGLARRFNVAGLNREVQARPSAIIGGRQGA